jgi:hypothetical protein
MKTSSVLVLILAGQLDVEAFQGHYPARTFCSAPQAKALTSKRPLGRRGVTSPCDHRMTKQQPYRRQSKTALNLLLEVPDGFFTLSFFMLGILLSISKNFARVRLEERAWEQRLQEGRMRALRNEPALTELDLRRAEAATEWSAYGTSPKAAASSRSRSVAVAERMSDDDIREFERDYGVAYDPYYDDPYEEDELPEGRYQVDRQYGDRIYQDGEIFYKDSKSGLFYRQGSKPRNYRFFG